MPPRKKNLTRHPSSLQDPFLISKEENPNSKSFDISVEMPEIPKPEYLLKLNLSGPPGCPLTELEQVKTLLGDPVPGWVLSFDGREYTIGHARQNLDTGHLTLWLGAEWAEAETYQAQLARLLELGWMPVVPPLPSKKKDAEKLIAGLEMIQQAAADTIKKIQEMPAWP